MMIEIKGTGTDKEIVTVLLETTIGTCDYSARIFDITGEILHTARAINGITLQWVTKIDTLSMVTFASDAVQQIAILYPKPEANPDEGKALPPIW